MAPHGPRPSRDVGAVHMVGRSAGRTIGRPVQAPVRTRDSAAHARTRAGRDQARAPLPPRATMDPAGDAAVAAVDASAHAAPESCAMGGRPSSGSDNNDAKSGASPATNGGNTADPVPEATDESMISLQLVLPMGNREISVVVPEEGRVADILAMLLDVREMCYYTNCHVEFHGARLPDLLPLRHVAGLQSGAKLYIRESDYTEATARVHLRQLQAMLADNGPADIYLGGRFRSPTAFRAIAGPDPPCGADAARGRRPRRSGLPSDLPVGSGMVHGEDVPLERLYPSSGRASAKPIECLRMLRLSGWNPVPSHRRLQGDLLYIDCETLEGDSLCITACPRGFFVNRCASVFDPEPRTAAYHSATLAGLLEKTSLRFKRHFALLADEAAERHPYEVAPLAYRFAAWAAPRIPHTHSLSRLDAMYAMAGAMAGAGGAIGWAAGVNDLATNATAQRDWNEEWQSAHDLPVETQAQRMTRDHVLRRIHADFVAAARDAAIAVLSGNVPPMNPLVPQSAQVFVVNNIFFSFASCSAELLRIFGSENSCRTALGVQLRGASLVTPLASMDVYALLEVIIDHLGQRLLAQGIPMGVLSGKRDINILCGLINGQQVGISADSEHLALLQSVGRQLHIKDHDVVDGDGKAQRFCVPSASQVMLGNDGRVYLLDLPHLFPPDANYVAPDGACRVPGVPDTEYTAQFVRPELVSAYVRARLARCLSGAMAELRTETPLGAAETISASAQPDAVTGTAEDGQMAAHADESVTASSPGMGSLPDGLATVATDLDRFSWSFNPDVWRGAVGDAVAADEAVLRDVATFLLDAAVPAFVRGAQRRALRYCADARTVSNARSGGAAAAHQPCRLRRRDVDAGDAR